MWQKSLEEPELRCSWVWTSDPCNGFPEMTDTCAYFRTKPHPVRKHPTIGAGRSSPVKMKNPKNHPDSIHLVKVRNFREPQRFSQTKPAPAKKRSELMKNLGMLIIWMLHQKQMPQSSAHS